MTVEVNRARGALGALRFITDPPISEELKEAAYQQVMAQLDRLAMLEDDLAYYRIHVLNSGQILFRVHTTDACAGEHCVIHNPSDHHMRDWPAYMRQDDFACKLVERHCKHGVGHPDPDSAAWLDQNGPEGSRGTWSIHGCDGCCCPREEQAIFDAENG